MNYTTSKTTALSSSSLMSTLSKKYHLRKDLQKIEFFTCWAIIFISLGLTISHHDTPCSDDERCTAHTSSILSSQTQLLLPYMTFYLKASIVSRFIAYLFDFSNAAIKNHGALPLWLVLHHSGVLIQHISEAILLDGSSCVQVMLFALGCQSTHNTWTKKISIVLYWGNVFMGVVTGIYLNSMHGSHSNSSGASSLAFFSFLVTNCGVVLLIVDTYCQKMKGKLCLRMSTTSSTSRSSIMIKQVSQKKMI